MRGRLSWASIEVEQCALELDFDELEPSIVLSGSTSDVRDVGDSGVKIKSVAAAVEIRSLFATLRKDVYIVCLRIAI